MYGVGRAKKFSQNAKRIGFSSLKVLVVQPPGIWHGLASERDTVIICHKIRGMHLESYASALLLNVDMFLAIFAVSVCMTPYVSM